MEDTNESNSLEQQLRAAYRVEPPSGLKERLLKIPDEVAQSAPSPAVGALPPRASLQSAGLFSRWRTAVAAFQWRLAVPAMAVIAAVAIVWTAGLRMTQQDTAVQNDEATRIAQEQAIRDFVTVMSYLHLSTVRANAAVHDELGAGLLIAFERGEQSFRDTSNRITNGG